MNGYQTYQTFIALKNYFHHDYDYFKYNGKTNISETSFMNRSDKWLFVKLARKYSDPESYFLANFVYGDPVWINDMMTSEADKNFKRWLKNTQAIKKIFEDNIRYMYSLKDPFLVKDGQNPPLLTAIYRNDITIETLLILECIGPFIHHWNTSIIDPILWPKFYNKCIKYKPWIEKLDIPKFKEIFKKVINEGKDN